MAKDSPSLVERMQKASPKDLEHIDATIADLKVRQAELQNAIDGLLAIRKALDIRLNGKRPRQVKGKPKPSAADEPQSDAKQPDGKGPDDRQQVDPREDPARARGRQKIHDYLTRIGKPQKVTTIGVACGIDGRTVLALVRHPWFKCDSEGVSVA